MSVTFVAAGVASEGSNTDRTPALPAGLTAGDVLLVFASIRNSGTGVPNAPAGYSTLLNMSNAKIFGKVATSSEAAPTVTFTGGVANATCQAQTAAFRGLKGALAVGTTTNTGTGQNVQWPNGPALTGSRAVAIVAGWKQDDWTSLTGDLGARIGAAFSTLGDDSAIVWSWQLTTAPVTTGSWTVTGGASAVTRAGVLLLDADPLVTVTEQDSWPPRTQIAVTSLHTGDNVDVYRVVAGQWTLVRAGSIVGATDSSFLVIDAELPFGVPVSYAVYVNDLEIITDPVTYELDGGQVAITDAITGAVAETIIGRAGPRTFDRDRSVFRVGGENLVVSGQMPAGGEGSYELLAMTTSIRDGILWLLRNATQGIVQIRQAGSLGADGNPYDGVDAYLSILSVVENRWSQDGSDPRRLLTVEFVECSGWSPDLEGRGFTYGDMQTFMGAGTYADLATLFAPAGTYLDIALADWTA